MKQIRNPSNTQFSGEDDGQAWAEAKLHYADAFQALACSNSAPDKASPILASTAGVQQCGNRLSPMLESSQPPPLWRALRDWSPPPTMLSVSPLSSALSARNSRLLDYVSARRQIVGTEHQQPLADAKLFYADAYEAISCSQSARDHASATILASDAEVRKRGHRASSLLDQSQPPPLWRLIHNSSPLIRPKNRAAKQISLRAQNIYAKLRLQESWDTRDTRDIRDIRDVRDNKDVRDIRDVRDNRDVRSKGSAMDNEPEQDALFDTDDPDVRER